MLSAAREAKAASGLILRDELKHRRRVLRRMNHVSEEARAVCPCVCSHRTLSLLTRHCFKPLNTNSLTVQSTCFNLTFVYVYVYVSLKSSEHFVHRVLYDQTVASEYAVCVNRDGTVSRALC